MRRLVVLTALVAVTIAACTSGGGDSGADSTPAVETEADFDQYLAEAAAVPLADSDAAEPPVLPTSAGGASGYTRYVFREFEGQVLTSLVEGPLGRQVRCQDVELPCSYEDLKELHESDDEIPEELGLDADELATLVGELDQTRAVIERYADVNDACADGYFSDRTQSPNMGSHFTKYSLIADGEFDPGEPEILIYAAAGGVEPTPEIVGQCKNGQWDGGEMEIVAAAYIVLTGQVGDDHPEGYTGEIDNWHVHYNLCRGIGRDSIVTEEECEARGGRWAGTLGWMMHAWVAPGYDNQLGVFSMWNPTVWPISDPEVIKGERTATISDAAPGAALASIENFSFGDVEVEAGNAVTWANSDSVAHTVTAGSASSPLDVFDSGVFAPGESFEVTFDEPGEYEFFCTLHPDMSGTVIVE
ncbi:MAG: plastocyanin/azurin family copper-binding protein [Acidimicrobiia bacterium]|nr:plastocyanin/azurin family copper-binding protein [Acidimicrobiia bacterium]